jgi:serine/threonine protein phosphatase PrpC
LYIVADGVSGNAAGDVASRMAVDTVRAAFEGPHRPGLPLLPGDALAEDLDGRAVQEQAQRQDA